MSKLIDKFIDIKILIYYNLTVIFLTNNYQHLPYLDWHPESQ